MKPKSLALALALLVVACPALAQSPFGIGNAETAVQPGSGAVFGWIAAQQQEFFSSLRHALVGIRNGSAGVWWLVGLSFAYGVFHAAGPGHGKAVISTYMLANEVELRRGVALSFVSALLQAGTALLLVGAGWWLLRGSTISMTQAGRWLELASYALVAGFGGWLLAAKLVAIWKRRRVPALVTGGLAFASAGTAGGSAGPVPRSGPFMVRASGGFSAEICRDDEDDCDCGRLHIADPKRLGGTDFGLRAGLSAVLAVGLRPCSGAIVVLTFALVNGLYLAGTLSVLAMALGTAITVSALACLAVFSKDAATRLGGHRATMVRDAIEVSGAALLLVLGLALLLAGAQLPL